VSIPEEGLGLDAIHLWPHGEIWLNILDAFLVACYYVGIPMEPFNETASDVNHDGNINIMDALLIAQVYVGLITLE